MITKIVLIKISFLTALLIGFGWLFWSEVLSQSSLKSGLGCTPHDLEVSSITNNSAEVVWRTGRDCTGQAVVSKSEAGLENRQTFFELSPNTNHREVFNDLSPNTKYYLVIYSDGVAYSEGDEALTFLTK